jgi:hypothetical protein
MKKFDDRKLYFYFSIITLVIGIILGLIAFYSILIIEPEIQALLSAEENIPQNYEKAYSMLRDPQIFARYEHFDRVAYPIKNILRDFDNRINEGEAFTADDQLYLEILLERRILGSRLTRNTMIFLFLLSLLGWIFFFYERRKVKASS